MPPSRLFLTQALHGFGVAGELEEAAGEGGGAGVVASKQLRRGGGKGEGRGTAEEGQLVVCVGGVGGVGGWGGWVGWGGGGGGGAAAGPLRWCRYLHSSTPLG